MKNDINIPKVEGVAMAVVSEEHEEDGQVWNVYLLNLRDEPIDTILVSSRGYGNVAGEEVKTSELRHSIPQMDPQSYARIERIMEDVFPLNNQYWVSFYADGTLYDKKYIFLPESINKNNFTAVPLLEKRGVMIQ